MKQPDHFFRRVGQTLGIIPTPQTAAVDHLIKRNLSPTMGRRDAAVDRVRIPEDIFSRPAAERRETYRRLEMLLESARNDTAAILRMLSSPDTRRREARLDTVLAIYQQMAAALYAVADTQVLLTESRPEGCSGDTAGSVSRCESMLLNEFRELLDATRPPVDRYREYTTKSFSPENLPRYRKAYSENGFLFDSPGFTAGA
ncbi:MAG: hypothetical protein IJV89_04015 [Lentisphaeria bacterium]|nr:hypothetical protein [Lentisphaeria bacterium]